ncbi:MAG TPA: multidrug efflux SMR transporter [Pseudomonas sp.]|nr:multidrug efflux SMR transporter [Pseudomonas sp.]
MPGYLYLTIAIILEVIATSSMKALDGFNKPIPLILVVLGYPISLFLLSLVVKTVPVGVAYAIWSGMGIVLVSIAAFFIYQQKLDMPAIVGMSMIVGGVAIMQLFSNTTA